MRGASACYGPARVTLHDQMNAVTEKPREVLITGGDTRPGLAVARSLARRGVSLLVVGQKPDMAFRSRHVDLSVIGPSSKAQPRAFVDFLLELIEKYEIRLLIPLPDSDVFVVNRSRYEFEACTKLAIANDDSLRSVLDKRLNLEIARSVGVPCPRQFELKSPEQIPEMIELLGFPVVLKSPGPSFDPATPDPPFRVLFAHDERQLRGYVEAYCGSGNTPLFQECAVGSVHNLCCFAARGEVIAIHQYHSLRRHQGAGVLRRIVTPMPQVEHYARELMRAVKWDGVAHLGFFVSADQQRVWYMETNGRFWGSVQGSIDAGWDFPFWAYRYFRFGETPSPPPIRLGSLTCWHRGDLESLLTYYRGGEVPATGTHPTKLKATLQYLSGFRPAIHPDVFRWSDPLPGIVDHWRLLQLAWASMRRGASGRAGGASGP